jgi:hypothetical protein
MVVPTATAVAEGLCAANVPEMFGPRSRPICLAVGLMFIQILQRFYQRGCLARVPVDALRAHFRNADGHVLVGVIGPGHHRSKTVLDSVLDPAEVKVLSTHCAFVFYNLQIPRRPVLF